MTRKAVSIICLAPYIMERETGNSLKIKRYYEAATTDSIGMIMSTEDQLAGGFTKPLPQGRLYEFQHNLNLKPS
jgi:hypothetical protein